MDAFCGCTGVPSCGWQLEFDLEPVVPVFRAQQCGVAVV